MEKAVKMLLFSCLMTTFKSEDNSYKLSVLTFFLVFFTSFQFFGTIVWLSTYGCPIAQILFPIYKFHLKLIDMYF